MARCTACGAKAGFLMSLCNSCIEKGRIAARSGPSAPEVVQPANGRAERKRVLAAAAAIVVPVAIQTLVVLYAGDAFLFGMILSLPLGAWLISQIPTRPRAQATAVVLYLLVFGLFLFVYSLGLHISTQGF